MGGEGETSWRGPGVGRLQACDPEVVVLVMQHQHPIPPQQGALIAAVGTGVDPAVPYPQPHQPALVPVAAQQHFAGQADQVLLAHEAVRRLKP